MKRTTIMLEEEVLYDLKKIAQEQNQSTSSVMREALAAYVTEHYRTSPPTNPLLGLVGLGVSDEPTDVADGGDEEMLKEGVHPIHGWSVSHDHVG